jgi:putative tryptophan/tyrosine transport system substrate-binding protein
MRTELNLCEQRGPKHALLIAQHTVFCFALCAMFLAFSFPVAAEQKMPRIGILATTFPSAVSARDEAFRQGLRDLGYLEGKNIAVAYRYAEGKVDRFPGLAAELVRDQVDLIVAGSDPAVRAAKNATKTIPIVMVGVATNPVETGLVESLARPGGNITGFTNFAVETSGKRLELFKEAVPKIARVAFLYDPNNRGNFLQMKELQTVAGPLALVLQPWAVRRVEDIEKVFTALSKHQPGGLLVPGGALMNATTIRIAGFALKRRLPSFFARREGVEAGGLMSYDPDGVYQYRRAAVYVDKILKGAKPAELPIEQPTKFELVINLKTAKQIGLTIPPTVLARADRVIR